MTDRLEKLASFSIKVFLPILVLFSLAAPFLMPLNGYDRVFHLIWIDGFSRLMSAGVLIPRWLPDSFGGLGAPTFYFYPPLPYYITGSIRLLFPSLTPTLLYHLIGFLATWASFFTFKYFLRTLGVKPDKTVVPSLVFALAPYRFFDLYTRNGFGEHVGFLFLPLFFAALITILREKFRARDILLLGFGWAALVLSNIPLALVAAFGSIPILLIVHFGTHRIRSLTIAAVCMVLGSGIAAYYLLPILYFQKYSQIDNVLSFGGVAGDPAYFIRYLLNGANTTVGLVGLVDFIAAVLVIWTYYRTFVRKAASGSSSLVEADERVLARGFAWMSASVLIVSFPYLTLALWTHIIFLQLIQFTYRFDILLLFCGCTVFALYRGRKKSPIRWGIALWCVAGTVLIAQNLFGFKLHLVSVPYTPFDPAEYAPTYAYKSPGDVIRFAKDHAGDAYLLPSPGLLPQEHISAERNPTGGGSFECDLSVDHRAVLHTFFWPEWRFISDGKVLPLSPTEDGTISVVLPQGKYHAELTLVRSDAEINGGYGSLASLVLLLLYAQFIYMMRKKRA